MERFVVLNNIMLLFFLIFKKARSRKLGSSSFVLPEPLNVPGKKGESDIKITLKNKTKNPQPILLNL